MRRGLVVPAVIGLGVLVGVNTCNEEDGPTPAPPPPVGDCDHRGDEPADLGSYSGRPRVTSGPIDVRTWFGDLVNAGEKPGEEAEDGCSADASALRIHSPITPVVLSRLRAIAAKGAGNSDDVLAKIGDSHSVGVTFLHCFTGPDFDLGPFGHLQPTIDHFRNEKAAGTGSFERESGATVSGISAWGLIRGDPSLVDQELIAIRPGFATVLVGTNDAPYRTYQAFIGDMVVMVDELAEAGVIPLLSTVPPVADPEQHPKVLRYNGLLRALSASRALPLVDLHGALLTLEGWGLRGDGIHLTVDWNRGGGMAACRLVDGGLSFGANVRNLVTLEQIDRIRRAVVLGEVLNDEEGLLLGRGSAADPFRVNGIPFGDGRRRGDPLLLPAAELPEPCAGGKNGPGLVYEICLRDSTRVQAILFAGPDVGGSAEIRSVEGEGCLVHGQDEVSAILAPGRHRVVFRVLEGGDADSEVLMAIVAM